MISKHPEGLKREEKEREGHLAIYNFPATQGFLFF